MTSAEIINLLDFAKAGYAASLQGKNMTYDGRSVTLEAPSFYMNEINRLERQLTESTSSTNGYKPKLANLSDPQ